MATRTKVTPRRTALLGGADVRPSGPLLLTGAVIGSLVLSALLTLEILPTPIVGLATRLPEVGEISERDE